MTHENITAAAGVARLPLKLRTTATLLTGLVRGIRGGVDLVESVTKPNAFAVGSLGSNGGNAAARAVEESKLEIEITEIAMACRSIDRRDIFDCINFSFVELKLQMSSGLAISVL